VSTPTRAVFRELFDDAAMFPPGNASAADALTGHLRLRQSENSDLIGPLLVPARAWEAFCAAAAAAGNPQIAVVLIGTTTPPAPLPDGVSLTGFEIAVADVPLPDVDAGRSLAAEIALGPGAGRVLAAVAEEAAVPRPVVAKFRTGGVTADAFPTEETLARVIGSATEAGAPLKLTAGLHHAIRHTGAETGFEHQGFLNVLVAFAHALAGADRADLVGVLAEREPATVVDAWRAVGPDRAAAARRGFVSFGCCGVEDPIHDLTALGLLPG
jgi:hypothetical protein